MNVEPSNTMIMTIEKPIGNNLHGGKEEEHEGTWQKVDHLIME